MLAILADLALPVRYGYADVLWLAPVALALPLWCRGLGLPAASLVGLGLLLGRVISDPSAWPSSMHREGATRSS